MAKQKKNDEQRKSLIREMLERAANLIPGGKKIVERKKATGVVPESDKAKSPAGESTSGSSIDDEIRRRRAARKKALEEI